MEGPGLFPLYAWTWNHGTSLVYYITFYPIASNKSKWYNGYVRNFVEQYMGVVIVVGVVLAVLAAMIVSG